jgi:hypothetical protein
MYTCLDQSTGETASVPLGVEPEFVNPNPSDHIAAFRSPVSMNCAVKSHVYPPALVEWSRRVQGKYTGVNVGEWYNISEATEEDSGAYTCRANNRLSGPFLIKSVTLKVYVRGWCELTSISWDENTVSGKLEVFGTPKPKFIPLKPWHQLSFDTSNTTAISRPTEGIREVETIGQLEQYVTVGAKRQILVKRCVKHIDLHSTLTLNKSSCLWILFTPRESSTVCRQNPSKQAASMTKELSSHLHHTTGCSYTRDIHSLFIVTKGQCPSIRIGTTINPEINSSLTCWDTSRFENTLSQWHSDYGFVNISLYTTGKQGSTPAFCLDQSYGTQTMCHRIVYCYKRKEKKDRTLCLSNDGKYRKINNSANVQAHDEDLRLFC